MSFPVLPRTLAKRFLLYTLILGLFWPVGPAHGQRLDPAIRSTRGRQKAVITYAKRWVGTPYKFGGNTRTGVDCSGFVRQLYADVFHVYLPRSTDQQVQYGQYIHVDIENPDQALLPGDLLFYVDAHGKPRHVVVYLSNGLIAHSASKRGVVIDSIKTIAGRYIAGRRIIAPARHK